MGLRALTMASSVVLIAAAAVAEGPAEASAANQSQYVLQFEVYLTGQPLKQEIVVEQDRQFRVTTRQGRARWTISGKVGRAVNGHLPVLTKVEFFVSPREFQTLSTSRLLKLNDATIQHGGAIHGIQLAINAREATDDDRVSFDKELEDELRKQISRLPTSPPPQK